MRKTKSWIILAAALGCLPLLVAIAEPAADTAASPQSGLDGAKVFAWNCGSCHSERYPKERTDAQWDQIVTHMRVRANLTAEQAKAVLHYLQENN